MRKLFLFFNALLSVFCYGCRSKVFYVVAHRGNSSVAPENTLVACRSAWENGIKYIEIDVWESLDGVIICNHDGNFKRVSPGADDKAVRQMTLAEIKDFDVGSWKGEKFKGEKVPTLEEFFAILPEDVTVFLEIKSVGSDFPLQLLELMKKYDIPKERIVIISFSSESLANFNKLAKGFKSNLLFSIPNSKEDPSVPSKSAESVIANLKKLGVTGADCRIGSAVGREYIKKVQSAGLEFHVWTVDDVAEAARLYEAGVDSITTNCPVVIKKALSSSPEIR